jgi:SUKH-3 immunity protein
MSVTELNPKALSILRNIGWSGLSRNIERDLSDLQYRGFEPPPEYAVSILEQYSGIEFGAVDKTHRCRLEVCFGLNKAHEVPCVKSDIAEHEVIIGKKLYPIGSVDSFEIEEDNSYERFILLVSEDGSIYSSISYFISQEGYDIGDYINRLVEDQPLWKNNKDLIINYSRHDPRLKELRKRELAEERLSKSK